MIKTEALQNISYSHFLIVDKKMAGGGKTRHHRRPEPELVSPAEPEVLLLAAGVFPSNATAVYYIRDIRVDFIVLGHSEVQFW